MRGVTQTDLEIIGIQMKLVYHYHFKPDYLIFDDTNFSFDTLKIWLRELAFLNAGVKITLKTERNGQQEEFHCEGG